MHCIRCSKELSRTQIRKSRRWCSQECYKLDRKPQPEQKKCLNCQTSFIFIRSGSASKGRSGKYCSRSCAAIFSNKLRPKKPVTSRPRKPRSLVLPTRPVSYYRALGSNAFGLTARAEARKYAKSTGLPRRCTICDYEIFVELAHIKPLSNFPDESLMKETWEDNVVFMCPNHHKEYDLGLLSIKTFLRNP